jgi:hypothetical protein
MISELAASHDTGHVLDHLGGEHLMVINIGA